MRTVPIFLLGGWLVWVISQVLPRPLEVDEVIFAYWAKHPFLPLPHPPLYMNLLAFLHQGFGISPEMLRCLGLVMFGLTALVIHRVAERVESGAGWWAVWLLATNPLAIQGSMLLDIDNTLLLWWVAMSVWWVLRAKWPLNRQTLIGFGIWWAFGLLMKTTTPLVWPLGIFAVYAWRGQWRRGLRDVFLMGMIGAAVFLVIWTIYSTLTGIPWTRLFMGRVIDMFLRGPTDVGSSLLTELVERGVRIGLWIGPAMLALWMFSTWIAYRHRRQLRRIEAWVFAIVVGWILLLGYWLVGGVVWSFAKYHTPLIPLVAIIGGAIVVRMTREARVSSGLCLILIGAMALWQGAVVGDLLYLVNHTLRHAVIAASSEASRVIFTLLVRGGLLVAGPLIMGAMLWTARQHYHLTHRRVVALVLVISTMGHGIGLLTLQAPAPYSTIYCYGRPWNTDSAIIKALQARLAEAPQARVLVSDRPYLQVTGVECEPASTSCHYWTGHETVEQLAVLLQTTDYMIVDPDNNSMHLLQVVLPDPRVQAILSRDFEMSSVETATAWTRRSLRRSGADERS